MLNPLLSFEEYNPNGNYPPQGFIDDFPGKPASLFSLEDMGGGAIDDLWSSIGFYPSSPIDKGATYLSPDDPQCFPEFTELYETHFNAVSAAIQLCERSPLMAADGGNRPLMSEITDLLESKEKDSPTSLSSLELLNNYHPQSCNHFSEERITESFMDKQMNAIERGRELSTEEMVRLAAAHFIQLSGDPSVLRLPAGLTFSGLSAEEIKNVELANLLFAAAEKVSNKQYDRASNLLRQCYRSSSNYGNPVQRVVYYFTDALQERIDRETGRLSSKGTKESSAPMTAQYVLKSMLENHPMQLICHEIMPFSQVLQFTAVQAILDSIATAKKIHMIDFSIKHGLHWTILMQALATRHACPIESLRISALGSSEEVIATTGKRLSSFAESLSLPFDFKTVVVNDMKDLREHMFELREGEVIGIYSDMNMNSMIVKPKSLENLMRVIWKLKPCMMAVIDVEAKLNSPSFINRFTEALFYCSALFDCLESVMERNSDNRLVLEGSFFSPGIQNVVAAEGSERVMRQVGVSVWREFFARFGLMETELNEYTVYQASLLLKQFVDGDLYTLEKNGKSLLIGWKGTPQYFVSAWQFQKKEVKV